jgi:hypothetical protein
MTRRWAHLERLPRQTVHTLLVSDAWDTGNVGGEEVDVEWLLDAASAPGTELVAFLAVTRSPRRGLTPRPGRSRPLSAPALARTGSCRP